MSAVQTTPPSPALQTDTILSINNIEVIYDHVILVLKGVSLQVPRAASSRCSARNGAGKTTTLKAISNLLHARARRGHQGHDRVRGERIDKLTPERAGAARLYPGDGGPPLLRAT